MSISSGYIDGSVSRAAISCWAHEAEVLGNEDRKAAIAAYKDRRVFAGVYALRCIPTGERWVGTVPDLSTIRNRLWFTLRCANHPARRLQAAWNEHGADHFSFETLERLDDEASGTIREAAIKDRLAHWRTALSALVV
jgi:hypothetical protein